VSVAVEQAGRPGWLGGHAARVDAALLAVVVVVAGVFDWAFAAQSGFFSDDFVQLEDAHAQGLHFGLLSEQAIVHFSPGSRFFIYVVERLSAPDFHFGLAILLAFQCASIVFLQRTLAALFGRRWWTFVLALAFGVGIAFLPGLQWYTAGLLSVPATAFSLACIHAYVRWWRSARPAWLVWSLVALCGALLFYEKAVFVPVYLVLLRLLPLRARPREPLREWRVWALYSLPVVVYLVIYVAGDYGETNGAIVVDKLPDFLRIAWLDGFVPTVAGLRVPAGGAELTRTLGVALVQVALAAAIVVSVVRRRSAWRAWVFLGIAFLLNLLAIVPRLGPFGPEVAYVTRYYTELAYLTPLALACAFAVPVPRDRPPPTRLTAPSPRALVAGVALLAAYLGLTVWSSIEITRDAPGYVARPWVDNFTSGLAHLQAGGGPAVVDGYAPQYVLPGFVATSRKPAANRLSAMAAIYGDAVRWNGLGRPTYTVNRSGAVVPARFVPATATSLDALRRSGVATLRGGRWYRDGGATCVRAGGILATLTLPPRPALRGHRYALRVVYRTSPDGTMTVSHNAGVGYDRKPVALLGAAPGGSGAMIPFDTLPTGVPTLAGVQLGVPKGASACFGSLALGRVLPAVGSPP
jgi:hypothetical protein